MILPYLKSPRFEPVFDFQCGCIYLRQEINLEEPRASNRRECWLGLGLAIRLGEIKSTVPSITVFRVATLLAGIQERKNTRLHFGRKWHERAFVHLCVALSRVDKGCVTCTDANTNSKTCLI